MQRKTIDPQILQQLHNLDNPGPGALRPSQSKSKSAPKKQGDYSNRYGLDSEGYKTNQQNLYTPALSLAEHQQVSNQAHKDSARQTALDYSYAQKAARLNQEIGQQDFVNQSRITNFNDRMNRIQMAGIQGSQTQLQGSINAASQRAQGRNQRNLARINEAGANNRTAMQTQAQRDMNLQNIAAQESMANRDRAANLATAKLQADTQREIASESNRYSLANNVLSGSRAGYRYW